MIGHLRHLPPKCHSLKGRSRKLSSRRNSTGKPRSALTRRGFCHQPVTARHHFCCRLPLCHSLGSSLAPASPERRGFSFGCSSIGQLAAWLVLAENGGPCPPFDGTGQGNSAPALSAPGRGFFLCPLYRPMNCAAVPSCYGGARLHSLAGGNLSSLSPGACRVARRGFSLCGTEHVQRR